MSRMEAVYRYRLDRGPFLLGDKGRAVWVMLNPSTADEHEDDPTIRRVTRFTTDAGFTAFTVVNLFAARSTNPKHLVSFDDPVGPQNEETIRAAFDTADQVVFAWGAWAVPPTMRRVDVERLAADTGHTPVCLGVTQTGHPRHQLYVRANQPFVPYAP